MVRRLSVGGGGSRTLPRELERGHRARAQLWRLQTYRLSINSDMYVEWLKELSTFRNGGLIERWPTAVALYGWSWACGREHFGKAITMNENDTSRQYIKCSLITMCHFLVDRSHSKRSFFLALMKRCKLCHNLTVQLCIAFELHWLV